MPDTLSLSAGVSLGLLAGIVSGVCYLVANGLAWTKPDDRHRRCLPSPDDGVCFKCGGDTRGGLVPCICRPKPLKFESGAWFLHQVQRAVSLMPWSLSTDKLEQIDEEYEGRESPGPSDTHELRNVREFLETLSAKLAGGPLEGTRVAPLYDHPAYLPASRRGSQSSASTAHPSGASGAHVHLKRLVARVVEEAAALPALARYAAEPPRTPTLESSTYEDLLATAILNKVIERYQTENGSGGRSSGIHSASASPTPSERSSPRSLNSRHLRDTTPPLREVDVSDWEEGDVSEDVAELPRRVPFPEFGGDIVHQATENEDRDFDEVSGSDIQAVDGSWEENWLFQKKKIKTIQSVPVPMLVPNSNTEYRVLIGDRDADDTTDLSDNASDAEEDAEYKSDIKRVLDSKHLIGGKTKIDEEDFEPDSLTIIDGNDDFEKSNDFEFQDKQVLDAVNNDINDNKIKENGNDSVMILDIDSGPLSKAEFNLKEEIHRTLLNGNGEFVNIDELNSITSDVNKDVVDVFTSAKGSTNTLASRHEREGEYEETVARPVQRYADSLRRQHFHDEPQEIPTRDTDKEDDLIPGSIAYRERKKWLNYVEMPNNPYSPEAIQKRLMTKSTSSLFDILTTKTNDLNDENETDISKDVPDPKTSLNEEASVKEVKENGHTLNVNGNVNMNGRRSKSPSPKLLKNVLAEEIPPYKRYDRDYYIREAKSSAGSRKKNNFSDTSSLSSMNKSISLDNFDTELSPGLLIKQINTIAANQEYTKFAKDQPKESITITTSSNKTEILIEYDDDTHEQTLFSAKPVYVDDDTDQRFEEIMQDAYATGDTEIKINNEPIKSPTNVSVDNSYISTSSLEDSIKIYNVQTGEIVKCQPEDKLSQFEVTDKKDNIDIVDKTPEETESSVSENVDDELVTIVEKSQETEITDEETIKELERISEVEEILAQLPKVKELAKKFVSMDNIHEPVKLPQPVFKRRKSKDNLLNSEKSSKVYMHSLTARSISKEFREELKMSMATPLTVPGGSKEIPEGEEVTKESSRPGSPLPEPGTIKTKLAFFESLKSKFSTK
ncbi:uncharacterized protein M7BP isoform X2 [Plodia interpunctella]|uniref:uncharacterized protein M7BP isoform X2 n=1 Tax=Plodia interpunctella TaxID=58824 RepID=UPI002367E0FC|nr:uncharacterized protein LOC128680185 isoform X2 [Plodia interpunctella]